jgi:DNA-binding HxlR family transcriptional regulator
MGDYGQYCPVARAAQILGDRWTLLIVRDLLLGTRRFNDLARGLPKLSRGLLSQRLRSLQEAGILEPHDPALGGRQEYRLTHAGLQLWPVVESLLVWGAEFAFGVPEANELDPVLLMWWMHRRVCLDNLPDDRVVVQFDFEEDPGSSYWLVLDRRDVTVCLAPPDFDTDVWVSARLSAMYRLWLGHIDYGTALDEGVIEVRSLPRLERDFPTWFLWSEAAGPVRAARYAGSSEGSPADIRTAVTAT